MLTYCVYITYESLRTGELHVAKHPCAELSAAFRVLADSTEVRKDWFDEPVGAVLRNEATKTVIGRFNRRYRMGQWQEAL